MTIHELMTRLEDYYGFECEGGPLRKCVEWHELRERAQETEAWAKFLCDWVDVNHGSGESDRAWKEFKVV